MTRAGLILILENKVALIERYRAGLHYYIFPGGQIESGETLHQAVVREAQEELGLIVQVRKLIATVIFENKPQYYFLVNSSGGYFGKGKGPEMIGLYPPENGTYQAIWMPSQDLLHHDVRPAQLIPIINKGILGEWPDSPLTTSEEPK